jgi:flagellin-specific chaperone FliS
MTFCLIAANRTNNRKSVDDVIKLLAELREAWIVIDPQKTAGTNSVSTAATLPRQFVYS